MNENGKRIELICGENDYLKKQYINSLVSKETSTDQENVSEVIYIDGKSASIEELQNALMTIPFFAEYNLVVIYNLIEKYKNNTDTKKKSAKKGSNNWNTILEFFNSLPIQKQILLVEHWQTPKDITGNPSDEKKDLKVEVDHLIEKLGLKNLTITKQFKNLLPIELETWITKELLNNGKKISNRNARLIAEYVGNDMWTLSNEIEKILNYCQGEIIEEEHLEILINNTKEMQIFKLVDLLLDENIAVSFKNIPSIFESGYSTQYLLSMLSRQMRLLIIAKQLSSMNSSKTIYKDKLGIRSDYLIDNIISQVGNRDMDVLLKLYEKISELDIAIKTGAINENIVFDNLISNRVVN